MAHPRRADARRSSECAFLHRKNRFSPANVRTAPGARGVSPPWCGSRLCSGKRNHSAKITRRCRCVFRYHGGLMPAALANVRSCTAKIVFFACKRSLSQQERGASAPRGMFSVCEIRSVETQRVAGCKRGFRPAAELASVAGQNRPQLQLRYQTHGGLTHRRSCECAFLHRKKSFFSPANVRTATRAGGVSPPWDVLGMRTRNVETQRVAVANAVSDRRRANDGRQTEPSAIATALPNPRRADAPSLLIACVRQSLNKLGSRGTSRLWHTHGGLTPAALVNLRSCIAKIVFSPANVRTAT
jgi:hypothetical protein